MGSELHRVTQSELPILLDWLEKYLPRSAIMYGTVSAVLKGKWRGTIFYTLGWPDILVFAQGLADPATSPCPKHYNVLQTVTVFSPQAEHLEKVLLRGDLYDWTRPILFVGTSQENTDVIQRVSQDKGSQFYHRFECVAMKAEPGDLKIQPVPEGYEARHMEPHLHAEYVTSSWPHRTKHSDSYIRALMDHLPSMGLFTCRDKNPIAVAVSTEWGFPAFLHVREESRGRGLGACVASLLAWELLQENGHVLATIILDNEASIIMHRKIGYKPAYRLDWFLHRMTNEKLIGSE